MLRFVKGLGLVVLLIGAVTVLGCSSPSASQAERSTPLPSPTPSSSVRLPTNGLVQSSAGGQVTIDVKWAGERNSSLVFEVSMNTHSVDLDQYDLGKLTVLLDDQGKEYRSTSWSAALGGHHREGTLAFPVPELLRAGSANYLQLVIRDVAGVRERTLRWQLG